MALTFRVLKAPPGHVYGGVYMPSHTKKAKGGENVISCRKALQGGEYGQSSLFQKKSLTPTLHNENLVTER